MTSLFKRRGFLLLVVIIVVGAVIFYLRYSRYQNAEIPDVSDGTTITGKVSGTEHGLCLGNKEIVEYNRVSEHPYITQPGESSPTFYVKDSTTGGLRISFSIDDIRDSGHPVEVRKCGIYVIREFNYDPQKIKQGIGYREELWKYDYQGEKYSLVLLAEKPNEFVSYYSPEFSVAPSESHISLIRGYLGKDDYAVVIKNLRNLEDDFILSIQEIEKRSPDLVQDVSFYPGGWTDDSRYFWANTHYGANTLGFIRIDMQMRTFDLFPAPKNVLGGDALNLERGLITIHPGNVWFGIEQVEQQEKDERRARGIGTELYIYDLFTKKQQLVASTTEPLYYFKPRWISDTELQYIAPDGGKRIYKVK